MATPALKFTTTSKGKHLLICDGYAYTLNKDRINVKYWRCQERTCSATIHTDKNDNFRTRSGTHNHLPSPEYVELIELRHNIKRRVLQENTPIGLIYDQELAAAQLTLPTLSIAPSANEARTYLLFYPLILSTYNLLFIRSIFSTNPSKNNTTSSNVKYFRHIRSIQSNFKR
jgi:hypothetical protein